MLRRAGAVGMTGDQELGFAVLADDRRDLVHGAVEARLDAVGIDLEGGCTRHSDQQLIVRQLLHADHATGDLIGERLFEVLALVLHVGADGGSDQGPPDRADQCAASRIGAERADDCTRGGASGGAERRARAGLGQAGAVGGTADDQDGGKGGGGEAFEGT